MEFKNDSFDNVMFLYTSIQTPVTNKFADVGSAKEREFKTTVVMSPADAKAFNKRYPKNNPKPIPNDEFREQYKIDVPFPESLIQYVTTLKLNHTKSDGSEWGENMRPKAFLQTADNNVYDITHKYLIGNGSRGKVNIVAWDSDKNPGIFYPKLNSIVVTRLVKYERPAGSGVFAERAEVEELPDDIDLSGVIVEDANGTPAEDVKPDANKPPKTSTAATGGVDDSQLPF